MIFTVKVGSFWALFRSISAKTSSCYHTRLGRFLVASPPEGFLWGYTLNIEGPTRPFYSTLALLFVLSLGLFVAYSLVNPYPLHKFTVEVPNGSFYDAELLYGPILTERHARVWDTVQLGATGTLGLRTRSTTLTATCIY